jgi:hypothetical protein
MVNIDTVYQRVLAIANKEQRGYITPLEFNLYANQAQMDTFEQYFYDLNQFLRIPGNNTEYSDVVNIIEEKINIFESSADVTQIYVAGFGTVDISNLSNFYRLGSVQFNGVEIEKIEHKDFKVIDRSPLTKPTLSRPIYFKQGGVLHIRPFSIVAAAGGIEVFYIRKPHTVEWGYVVTLEKALYNATTSRNFELHASEEADLVIKILTLAGITMDDQALYQIASQEDVKNIKQEKQ